VLFVSAGKGVVWFDKYGRKNGFIVYILRYFLLQNWGWYLQITDKEFLALAAMAFGRPNEKQYQQIELRPTPRCASIASRPSKSDAINLSVEQGKSITIP
jgi:hypothetical protein